VEDFIFKYWFETICTSILAGVTWVVRRLYIKREEESNEQRLIKEGVVAILHDRLYQSCRHHISNEHISITELKNIEYLYRSYNALGGNGTGTEIYNRCVKLQIVND